MRRQPRAILLAALALTVPLPAFALSQADEQTVTGPAGLAVSTALEGCGLAESQVVCEIGVSFETLPDATSYTASVTSPDGAVTDAGAIAAGGASIFVPYVGSGTYSVRVNAYGAPEEPGGEEELIESDVATDFEQTEGEPRDANVGKPDAAVKADAAGPAPDAGGSEEPAAAEEPAAVECVETVPPAIEPPPEVEAEPPPEQIETDQANGESAPALAPDTAATDSSEAEPSEPVPPAPTAPAGCPAP